MAASSSLTGTDLEQVEKMRDQALGFLAGPSDAARPPVMLKHLDALDLSEAQQEHPAYLEARISVILAQGKRPRMAQKALYRLSQARLAAEEGNKLGVFQDQLKDAKYSGHDMSGLFFFESFATLDHDQVWSDITVAVDHVRTIVGEVFLNSGTLLGAVREGGFIPHDDDVDLAVVLQSDNEADAAHEWIEVYHRFQAKGLIKKPPRRNYGVFKLRSTSGINVDVFPCWIEDDRINIYPHTKGELVSADVLPLKTCPSTNQPIPAEPEKMLEVNYGSGWREPDPGFSFPWGKANRRFKVFRDILHSDDSAWTIRETADT